MSTANLDDKPRGTRIATALDFDYQGRRLRTRAPRQQLNPPLAAAPEDQGSAIKQAIIRWLEER